MSSKQIRRFLALAIRLFVCVFVDVHQDLETAGCDNKRQPVKQSVSVYHAESPASSTR